MTLKNLLAFVLIIIMLSHCDNAEEHTAKDSSEDNTIFNQSVGGPVSPDVAARWVARKSRTSGREESFSVTADKLNALLSQTENKLGVMIHHAQGPSGQHHLFIAPVKSDLQSWGNGQVLDAVSNEFVDEEVASSWASAHKGLNPEGPWSHFYGIDLFDEITSINGFSKMDIVAGEDDGGQSQILLYVWSEEVTSNGRTKTQAGVYDRSAVCPPVCPNE